MKKVLFFFMLLIATSMGTAMATPHQVAFRKIIRTTSPNGHPHKSPVEAPTVYIEGNELTFATPCDGCTLQLVDENEDVVYTIIIPAETTTLYLPSDLEGIFELQIISGDWLFYAEIEL